MFVLALLDLRFPIGLLLRNMKAKKGCLQAHERLRRKPRCSCRWNCRRSASPQLVAAKHCCVGWLLPQQLLTLQRLMNSFAAVPIP